MTKTRRLAALDDLRPTDLREEIEGRIDLPEVTFPAGSQLARRVAAATVALALFIGGVVALFLAIRHAPAPAPPLDPWASYGSGWSELPKPPQWRDGAGMVWTGSELLYWGGTERGTKDPAPLASGFAFDPLTQQWSAIPDAPVPATYVTAVWTGTEALFFVLDGKSPVEAFDPSSSTWRTLPPSPHHPDGRSPTWVWAGNELIVWGGGSPDSPDASSGVALDVATGTWHQIAAAPVGMTLADAVWTGKEMVVVGAVLNDRNWALTPALVEAYDPATDTWRQLPDPPVSPQTSAIAYVDGRLLVWEQYSPASAEFLSDEGGWRSITVDGFQGGECYASGQTIDGVLFSWNCGSPVAWYAENSSWIHVEPPPSDQPGALAGSQGDQVGVSTGVVVQQTDTVTVHEEPTLGSEGAPVHLLFWRPTQPPPVQTYQPTPDDAAYVAERFVGSWDPGAKQFLPTLATSSVIDRCQSGTLPVRCAHLANWHLGGVSKSSADFRVTLELMQDHVAVASLTFTVGRGTTSDGRTGELIVIGVEGST